MNDETTGADRTGCNAWCGKRYMDKQVPPGRVAFLLDTREADEDPDEKAWCSPACRDARLPPIASPPKHVERRKGQRWNALAPKSGFHFDLTLLHRDATDHGWQTEDGSIWPDACWDDAFSAWTMTLLADAAPGPAKTHTCRDHCGALHCDCSKCGHDPALYRPSQEAPKAAPVPHDFSNPYCVTPVRSGERHRFCAACGVSTGDEWQPKSCVPDLGWRLAWENNIGHHASPLTDILRDPAIGDRLPRPQLAADWVEDCIPEGGR